LSLDNFRKFKSILLIVTVLVGILYLFLRNELKAGIEIVKISFNTQKHVATATKSEAVPPWTELNLNKVYIGFNEPVYLTNSGDGSGEIFIVEKKGKIISVKKDTRVTLLDITDRVRSRESERGLLSVAFHPNFKTNGRYFVYYTDLRGNTIVSEFNAGSKDNNEKILLKIQQPYSNHNGGQLAFGPDGYLYIGTGDGGAAGDPLNNGQNKKSLLGKILRIDVDKGNPYGIPPDNPFLRKEGKNEIWAYGLRNPWRFSFDTSTGDLYIADVGQYKWEEINFQPANSKGGLNYGWRFMEGFNTFNIDKNVNTPSLTIPVMQYGHDDGCSVTGGYVYRGEKYKSIKGTYLFGDFCSGLSGD